MSGSEIHIGWDIGGTFTDIVAQMGDGALHVRKVASTPDDPPVRRLWPVSPNCSKWGASEAGGNRGHFAL